MPSAAATGADVSDLTALINALSEGKDPAAAAHAIGLVWTPSLLAMPNPDLEPISNAIVNACLQVLDDYAPEFIPTGQRHRVRRAILSCLHDRVAFLGSLPAPTLSSLTSACLAIMTSDNEDNGVLACNIVARLFASHGSALGAATAADALRFVETSYRNLPTMANDQHSSSPVVMRSAQSLRILSLCPNLLRGLMATHEAALMEALPALLAVMHKALKFNLRQNKANVRACHLLISVQARTLSFIAGLVRVQAPATRDLLLPLQDTLCTSTRQLLLVCGSDRENVLEALRALGGSELRRGVYRHLNVFLDTAVLLGRGADPVRHRAMHELALEIISDIVKRASAEGELNSLGQLANIIHTFALNVHDRTLPANMQVMSLQVVLALVENIFRVSTTNRVDRPDVAGSVAAGGAVDDDMQTRGRHLLVRIFQMLVVKVESLADAIPRLVDEDDGTAPVNDVLALEQLLQVIVRDLQTLLWRIANISGALGSKGGWMFKIDECRLVSRFMRGALRCFALFELTSSEPTSSPPPPAVDVSEPSSEGGALDGSKRPSPIVPVASAASFVERFANVFVSLDPASFRRVVGVDIGHLFEAMVKYERLPRLVIPQQFLGNPSVSKIFADIVMIFVLERLEDMGAPTAAELRPNATDEEKTRSATALLLLNMFRIVAGSLSLYADNEDALLPYMARLVRRSVRLALRCRYKQHYLLMLRHLFRSIGGGKFQRLYETFVPLLPELLAGLSSLQDQAQNDQPTRELAVELCLTVPARLSTLLSYIPLMMHSVVRALESRDDQVVKIGLRTFEFWVDKLNHDYLFVNLASEISSAMRSLCALLRPSPAPFGAAALSLLGKLGGRNRRFLTDPMALPYRDNVHEGLSFRLLINNHRVSLPFSAILGKAVECLRQSTNLHSGGFDVHALNLIKACVPCIFDIDPSVPIDMHRLPVSQPPAAAPRTPFSMVDGADDDVDAGPVSLPDNAEQEMVMIVRRRPKLDALDVAAKRLIEGLLLIAAGGRAQPGPAREAQVYLERLIRFFALTYALDPRPLPPPASAMTSGGLLESERQVVIQALVDQLMEPSTFANERLHAAMLDAIEMFVDELIVLFGVDGASDSAAIDALLLRLMTACYGRSIASRTAGVAGLSILVRRLDERWLAGHTIEVANALIATLGEQTASYQQLRYYDPEDETDLVDSERSTDESFDTEAPTERTAALIEVAENNLLAIVDAFLDQDPSNDAILVNEMAAHLSDPLPSCRYICLRLMEHVAERREIHLGTLLSPILDKLAEPVLHRTLSKVAPSMRVGYVWSACLALRLRPSLVPPDQLVTLVRDTIESLKAGRSSRNRQPMGRASSLEFSRLTVEYISLMAVTVSSTPLSSNDDLRNAVVQSLFNALVDRNSGSRVVVAAKRGLAILCRHHKLPKALLRNCLEPVLRNLADSSTLTMPLLDLLEHLLQLLSHCFNVTLGRTLLDHLFFFSEAIKQMLTVPQPVALPALCKPGDEVRLPCRLLDLFHRLPPAPRQFLTKLVMAVVSLESMLPLLRVFGGHSVLQPSPFRPPLLRFVCKYAAEAVAFFLTPKNLVDRRLSQLFLEILASPSCGVVCETLIMLSDQLLAASFNIEQSQQTQAQQMQIHRQQQRQMRMQESGGADNAMDIDSAHDVPDTESVQRRQIPEKAVEELELQGVNIVYQLVQYRPLWLAQPEASRIVQAVFQSWMAQSNMSIVPDTPTEQVVKRIRLAHCLVSYWTSRLDPSLSTGSSPHSATSSMPISTLWMLLSATGTKAPVDFAFIDAFFMDEIALGLSIMKLAAVVRDFVANVLPPASTPDQPSHSTFTNADRCAGIRLLLLPIARLRPEREVRSIFSSVVGPLIDNADNESHSIGVKVELATLFAVLIERAHDLFKIGTLSQLSSFARAQLGVQQVPLLPTISGDESALQAATLLLLVRTAIASRSSKRCAYLGLYIRAFRCARTHDVCKDALDALATFFHQSFDELALEPPKSQAAHEFAQLHPFTASDQPEADDDVLLSGLFADIDVPAWVVLTGRVASSSPANALEVFRHVLRCDALFVPYLSHLGDALIQAVPLSADLANRQTAFPDRERVPVILDMVDQLFLWSSVAAVHNAELPASPSPPKRQKAPSKTRRTSSRSSSPRFHLSTSSLVSSHRWVASAPSATVVIGILIETFKRCLTAQQPATQAVSSRIITTLATASSVWPTASFAALDDVIAPLVSHLDGASLVHVLKLFDALLAGRSAPFLSESDIRTVMIDGIIGRVFAVPVDDALLEAFQSFLRRLEATLPAAGADGEDVAPIYASLCKGIAAGIQHKDVDTLRLTLSALDLASLRTPLFLPGLNAALAAAQHTLMRRCLQASSAAVSGASASVKKAQGPSGSSAAATGQQHDKPALLCSLRLVERRAPSMREQRKQVLQTMLHLIDKSEDFDIVSSVVVIVCGWISGKHPLPDLTLKEKCNLLVRMSRFEEFAHSGGLADDGTGVLIRLFTAVLDVLHSEVKEGAPNAALLKLLARPVMGVLRSSEPDIHARMMRYLEALAGATVASRLEFIFETSGWATVADRFWLSHGLEMILSLAHADAPLFLSQEHSRLRVGSLSSEGGPAAITSQRQALGKQKDFIAMLTATKAGALIGPMYRLALADDSLARLSWERIFPIAWSLVPAGDQPGVTSVLSRVLSRDDLLKQLRYRPNVVHALLASFDRCDRPPDLRPELISYLGRTFGAWHSASALLDRLVLHPPMQPGVAADHALAVRALIELHSELSEHDVIAGIVQIRAVSPFTRAATALEQYGLWPRAQEEFFGALKSIQGPPGADAGGAPVPHPGADEAVMWEHEWVRCAKHLHQWAQIGDVASQLQRADLVLESASLAGDTAALESLCDKYGTDSHPTIPLSGLMYRLQTMSQQQAALVLRALGEDDGNGAPASDASSSVPLAVLIQRITTKQVSMLDRAMDIALQEWMRRPSFLGTAHVDLLSRFQQLVELREGRIMIDEAGKAFKQNRVPDFKNLLSAWRDRLPNYWDSITIWNEIVCGRLQVFQRLSAAFQSLASAPQQELAYNDTTWTVVKMAETARRQQLPQVCLTWLDKLPTAGLSPAESFAKLREQVKICLQTADEIRSAVSLLNQSPMDRYTGEQCAEMFRLKGEALEHLGHGEESHTAFSSSLAVCDDYGKGWLSWGAFCDQLFGLQKDRQWAEYTITCYLQAVRFHTSDRARLTLARVLWLLTYDKNDGPLNAVFKKYSLDLPVWVWLLWLPQLISSLSRPEGTAYTAILQNVAKSFPQAIYYDVRAYLHERRDHQRMMQQHAAAAAAAAVSRPVPPVAGSPEMRQDEAPPVTPPPVQIGTSPDVGPAAPSSTAASRAAGERSNANVRAVVTVLRQSHLNLVSELEKMLEEMGRCFRPEPQEELLSTVQALFLKCFRQPITAQDTVPQALTENIRRVCSKFFLQGGMHASSKPTLTRFMHLYRERFLREFLPPPDGTEYPTTLTRLMRKLKWWKSTLRRAVSQSHRQEHMRELVRLSTYLARFEARNIEIPGQYGNGAEPKPGAHVMLVRFSHLVGIVRHNGMSFRRIGFVGCDGTLRYFLVQFFVSHITKSDERMMQMGRILNQLMRKSRETRERSIALDVPAVVPLTNRLRLYECDPSFVSLDAVLEHMCFVKNMDADDALTVYRNQLGGVVDDERDAARHRIHKRIMMNHVPPNTLRQYLERTLPTHDALWAFKVEFAKQLGLTSFLTFALRIGDRTPQRIWFSRRTGRIVQNDFYPSYTPEHAIDHAEQVPFRLTPNLAEFCTPFLIEGVFGSAFISSAACWLRRQHILKNYLNLFLRDDLLSWSVTLQPIGSESALDDLERSLRAHVSQNTTAVLNRVQSLMPSSPPPPTTTTSDAPGAKVPAPINAKIQRLVEQATSIDNLSAMPATWHPWF